MPIPTQITYRHTASAEALEALIHQEIVQLEEFQDRITECHVVIDEPNQRHSVKHFRVEVIVRVPGAELVASADPGETTGADPYAAVRDAFRAVRRQLVEHIERTRYETKSLPGTGHSSTHARGH
jgi:putative sigma-54 modulation protein